MNDLLVVITSLPTIEAAKQLARNLVSEGLSACVQMHEGVHSIYRWEGRLCEEQEVLLLAKTTQDAWPKVQHYILQEHPYDLPEIIAQTITQYDESYGRWLKAEVLR